MQRPHTLPPPSPPRWDDSDDYVVSAFHAIQMVQQEGRKIELPEHLAKEEETRLTILV
jgi:hypothetical protein